MTEELDQGKPGPKRPRNKIAAEEIWSVFQCEGSLRAAGRFLDMNHMVVKDRLLKAGYDVDDKKPKTDSMSPKYKVYVRPAQFKALDELARQKKIDGRHAMARLLLDKALKQEIPDWEAGPFESA